MKLFGYNITKAENNIVKQENVIKEEPKKRASSVASVVLYQTPSYNIGSNIALYEMYKGIEQVRMIIDFLVQKAVSIPFIVENKRTKKVVEEHDFYKKLNTDILTQSFLEFFIFGNSYLNFSKSTKNYVEYIKKIPTMFAMANVANSNDLVNATVTSYELNTGLRQKFEANTIFHFKNNVVQDSSTFNPYGLAKLISAASGVSVLKYVYDCIITLYGKSGALGILSSKNGEFPIENVKALQKSYYDNYGFGVEKNAMMITNDAVDFTKISSPINEMLPIEVKADEFQFLCSTFGFDSMLLGDKRSSTYDNFNTAFKAFIENTLKPFLITYYNQLSTIIDTDFVAKPDFSELNESMKDIKLFNEVYEKMYINNVCTGNEWRVINNLQPESQYNGTKQPDTTSAKPIA